MDKKKNQSFLHWWHIILISFFIGYAPAIIATLIGYPLIVFDVSFFADIIHYYPFAVITLVLMTLFFVTRKTTLLKNYPFLILAIINILMIQTLLVAFYVPWLFEPFYMVALDRTCGGWFNPSPEAYYPHTNLCSVLGFPSGY